MFTKLDTYTVRTLLVMPQICCRWRNFEMLLGPLSLKINQQDHLRG